MHLQIGLDELSRAIAARERLSSEDVFGTEALTPPEPRAPAGEAGRSCHPKVSEEELALLRAAHGRLLGVGEFSQVLDLLGGSDRFIPEQGVGSLVGPAPPAARADAHRRLMLRVADDLNETPLLPFEDEAFDAVLVTLDVGALRRPLEVFREAGRVLQPAGLLAVSFAQARYDEDHTRLWALADDRERLMLTEGFIEFAAAGFTTPASMTFFRGEQGGEESLEWSEGRVPLEDPELPHAHLVFAYRDSVAPAHLARPPFPLPAAQPAKTKADIRYDEAGRPCCPYCGAPMGRYEPPVTVFEIDYGVDQLYVCFEDACEYYRRSRRWMRSQGHPGFTYRFMLDPATGATGPLPDNLWGGLRTCRIE